MQVDQDTCIGCGECLPYCPVGVISLVDGVAVADQDGCVECRVCTRAFSCPTDSMIQLSAEELGFPNGSPAVAQRQDQRGARPADRAGLSETWS